MFFDAGFSARLWGEFSVGDCHFDLSQKGDDLLWAVLLPSHLPAPLVPDLLSLHLVQNSQVTSVASVVDAKLAAKEAYVLIYQTVIIQATTLAYVDTFLVLAMIAAIMFVLSFALRRE